MYTWKEIQEMSDEEIARANKRLVRKVVLTRIILPVAAVAAVEVFFNRLEKRQDSENED